MNSAVEQAIFNAGVPSHVLNILHFSFISIIIVFISLFFLMGFSLHLLTVLIISCCLYAAILWYSIAFISRFIREERQARRRKKKRFYRAQK